MTYKNRIPPGIVEMFKKHGFISEGKWHHYDTMYFEYRSELLLLVKTISSPKQKDDVSFTSIHS
mgnify:FL=1|tara:strand:- start:1044 stop:1235 length:192 start_codon:yes stop_codon:yes gene_type:complete